MSEAVCGESSVMTELETNSESARPPEERPFGPEFAVASQPSYARTLFLGPDGLRAGWGLAFYVGMFLSLQWLAAYLAWSHDFGSSGLWSMMLEELGSFAAAA